jgi:hypothetical protein
MSLVITASVQPRDMHHIEILREACRGYPRKAITNAVEKGLEDLIRHGEERQSLAAMIAAWVIDEDLASELPPISPAMVERVCRELGACLH